MENNIDLYNAEPLLSCDWYLFRLIKERGGLTFAEVCRSLPQFFVWTDTIECHGNHCQALYESIKRINKSNEIDKLIYLDRNTKIISFATKEQCEHMAKHYHDLAMPYLELESKIKKKMVLDGQGKILSNQGKLIDEKSQAKKHIETYSKDLFGFLPIFK